MTIRLRVWRQRSAAERGAFAVYTVPRVVPEMSFLEMLDALNEELTLRGEGPIAFESDCREGICGSCGMMINGIPHGPQRGSAVCQLHMRHFRDGELITVEPWRAAAFPVIRDLIVNRSAFDRIVEAGGFITAPTGSAPEANVIPVAKADVERAMDAAQCIACGACVAVCPNASAALFTAAKISHLGLLPQGQPERHARVLRMVTAMNQEGFGQCTNTGECEAVCPKRISINFIARMNRDYLRAQFSRGAREAR